jgi:hypothetical protein
MTRLEIPVAATFLGLTHSPKRTKTSFSAKPKSRLHGSQLGAVQCWTVSGVDAGYHESGKT